MGSIAEVLGSDRPGGFERIRSSASAELTRIPVDFLEIRVVGRTLFEVVQAGNTLDALISHAEIGAHVRALSDGSWGSSWLSLGGSMRDAVERAARSASASGPGSVVLAESGPARDFFDPPVIEPLGEVTPREKTFLCRRYSELLASSMRDLSTRVHYREVVTDRAILNTRGVDVRERHSLCGLRMEAVGGSSRTQVSRDIAYRGGFEFVRNREDLVEDMIGKLSERDTDRSVEPGVHDVIIDPQLAGILVHEAFGHMSEADFLLANPVVADALRPGRRVATEALTIVDDSTHLGLPGSCAYDDEGTPGQRTELVSRGVIRGRLHSLETAGAFGEKSTGNARALGFMHAPSVRMTCTCVEPGGRSLDDLLQLMGKGLYLSGSLGGATNMSRFSFTAEEAWEVSGGRIRKPLRPVRISGRVFDVLGSISSVANDMRLSSSIGGCSKAEQRFIPVSYGGPHLLLADMEIG